MGNVAEWKTLIKSLGGPLVLPIFIAVCVLVTCCCCIGCLLQWRNKRFDVYVQKLRRRKGGGGGGSEHGYEGERDSMLRSGRSVSSDEDDDRGHKQRQESDVNVVFKKPTDKPADWV